MRDLEGCGGNRMDGEEQRHSYISSAPLLYTHRKLEQRQTNPKNLGKKMEVEKKQQKKKKRIAAVHEIFRK